MNSAGRFELKAQKSKCNVNPASGFTQTFLLSGRHPKSANYFLSLASWLIFSQREENSSVELTLG
jgi:hypothetical protein